MLRLALVTSNLAGQFKINFESFSPIQFSAELVRYIVLFFSLFNAKIQNFRLIFYYFIFESHVFYI